MAHTELIEVTVVRALSVGAVAPGQLGGPCISNCEDANRNRSSNESSGERDHDL